MSKSTTSQKTETLIAAGTSAIALAIYLLTLAPTVLFADGGEFQFVTWLPGLAHPTGYPLYTLAGWLFSHTLPFGEAAWRMNLFSAVAAALAVGVVYLPGAQLTARLSPSAPLTARRLSAVGAALIFAFSQTFWSQAVIAEVYGMHALLVALILWATLQIKPAEKPCALTFRRGWLLALFFGLGLTHHRTIILMLPALLLYLWLSGCRKLSLKDGVKLLVIAALPNLLYLTLPLLAANSPYVKLELSQQQTLILYHNTFKGFLQHVSGAVFSAEVQPEAVGLDRLLMSLDFMRRQVGWLGGVLGLVGVFSLRKRPALLALTLGSFSGFLIFNLIYFIGDVYVLFIPCWLILSLWIGLGWLTLARITSQKLSSRNQIRGEGALLLGDATARMQIRLQKLLFVGLSGLLLGFVVVLLVTRYAKVDQSQNTIARDAWQEILLQELPDDAVLLSNDRNEMMPLWYYQYVENRRPDWLGLFPLITPNPEYANIGRALDQAFASQRPVYLIKPMPGLEIKADLQALPPLPRAQLFQASAPNLSPAQTTSLSYGDTLQIIGYDLQQQPELLTVTLYWQVSGDSPAKNYTSYVHLLNADGAGITQSDHLPGGVFYPPTLWSPGETLRDTHQLALPADLPPGEYTLIAGLYFQPEDGSLEKLGEGQTLTQFTISE
ncbi:MAG TPA: DUF2723 domain-containing protein [Chloroflexi bacterium]|nr:DUF2723 domain-containing protein [Chloroflexota bacterium]